MKSSVFISLHQAVDYALTHHQFSGDFYQRFGLARVNEICFKPRPFARLQRNATMNSHREDEI
jgi:hypothetical protein